MTTTLYLTKYWELLPTTITVPKKIGSDVQVSEHFAVCKGV